MVNRLLSQRRRNDGIRPSRSHLPKRKSANLQQHLACNEIIPIHTIILSFIDYPIHINALVRWGKSSEGLLRDKRGSDGGNWSGREERDVPPPLASKSSHRHWWSSTMCNEILRNPKTADLDPKGSSLSSASWPSVPWIPAAALP